jgi:hypothetical protein
LAVLINKINFSMVIVFERPLILNL